MKRCILLSLGLFLQSCSHIDDYLLGKDNIKNETPLVNTTPLSELREKWFIVTGNANNDVSNIKLKPVIVSDNIYAATPDGSVQARDRRTGKLIWSKKIQKSIISGLAIGQGYIAVTTSTAKLVLLKQDQGQDVWQVNLAAEAISNPIIYQNRVIIKTINGNLYAFNLLNGTRLWVNEHGAPPISMKVSSSPVIAEQQILAGFSDGKLDAVNLHNGNLIWQRSINYPRGASDIDRLIGIDADPVVINHKLYLATYQGYIGALSLKTGQFIWKKSVSTYKNFIIDQNLLYITDSDDVIWAFRLKDGRVQWKQPALQGRRVTEPAMFRHQLVVGDKSGYLHILSTETGKFVSRNKLSGSIVVAPVATSNNLYVLTSNGKLYNLV